eukprot:3828184-Prymnesium_polylepis.1
MDKGMNQFREVQDDLHEATELMRDNIEACVNRGEHLELLVDKSDNLTASARQFQKHSTGLRRALWWKNAKMLAMVGGSILAVRPRLLFLCPRRSRRAALCVAGERARVRVAPRRWFSSSSTLRRATADTERLATARFRSRGLHSG